MPTLPLLGAHVSQDDDDHGADDDDGDRDGVSDDDDKLSLTIMTN